MFERRDRLVDAGLVVVPSGELSAVHHHVVFVQIYREENDTRNNIITTVFRRLC